MSARPTGSLAAPTVTVQIQGANRSVAWVVLKWSAGEYEFGIDLSDGFGSGTAPAPNRALPEVDVYVDNLKLTSDLGCQA